MRSTVNSYNRIPPDVFITLDHAVYNKIEQGTRRFNFVSEWQPHLEQDAINHSREAHYAIVWCFYSKRDRLSWFRCFSYSSLEVLKRETVKVRTYHAYAIYERLM